jgi:acylphosphatase
MVSQENSGQIIQIHAWISGRVQGVGYRFSTADQADRLGIKGWVRNLPDGRVEAVFEGETNLINQMIQWCYQGPRAAKVKEVKLERGIVEGFKSFEILPTPF